MLKIQPIAKDPISNRLMHPAILFTAILLLLGTSCSLQSGSDPTPTPLPPLVSYEKTYYPVEEGAIEEHFALQGVVTPRTQEMLFFRSSGYISRVPFKGGDSVKQGDVLAELQIDDLLNQLQQAEIDLEVAQANLETHKTAQEFAVARAEHHVTLADLNLEQVKAAGGNKNQVAMAEENLALAKLALEEASSQVFTYDEQAVKRTQLVVDRLKAQISERQIVAPFDGVLFRHLLRPGEPVEAFDTVITIGDPSELVIRTPRNNTLSTLLNQDSEAFLALEDDYRLQFLPNFVPTGPSEDETQEEVLNAGYFYFALMDPIDEDLIPVGKPVDVTVITGRKDNALLLPPAVIREFGGLTFVILLEGDTQRRVEVLVGLETSEMVEVIGDIQAGDLVVGP